MFNSYANKAILYAEIAVRFESDEVQKMQLCLKMISLVMLNEGLDVHLYQQFTANNILNFYDRG
jgi:hypothetical protein